jgi:S-adenosylmethionine hydrolase
MSPTITLLTDFGDRDGYVGILKGVIAGICPTANVIDLTHQISPQDIAAARFVLLTAYGYFPAGTIHLVVVDPGVGTARRAIALQTARAYFVAPDNGVLSGVLERDTTHAAVSLTEPVYWRVPQPSQTFHGRDLFAPVAAHIARGTPLTELGTAISSENLVRLSFPPLQTKGSTVVAQIQHIDHFGNLITTLPASLVSADTWALHLQHTTIPAGTTYHDVLPGQLVALVGSHGWVEIAVNGGSAYERLRVQIGYEVELHSLPGHNTTATD